LGVFIWVKVMLITAGYADGANIILKDMHSAQFKVQQRSPSFDSLHKYEDRLQLTAFLVWYIVNSDIYGLI
jgi:hypothetical protein